MKDKNREGWRKNERDERKKEGYVEKKKIENIENVRKEGKREIQRIKVNEEIVWQRKKRKSKEWENEWT